MPKALVTGGAGFIGSTLVRELLRGGYRVRVLDDFSTGRQENLAEVADDVEVVEGNICDRIIVSDCTRDVDAVFHLAAVASVPQSMKDPAGTTRTNVEGTVNVLNAASQRDGTRVVFASSSAVYGNLGPFPKCETHTVDPQSPYALQKLVGESYARLFGDLSGLQTVCLRLFNVFGPRQRPDSDYAAVIPAFLAAMQSGRSLRVYGDGSQTRDFVFVEDVARAFRRGAESATEDPCVVLNIGTGDRQSLTRLVEYMAEATGIAPEVAHEPERQGDVKHSWASVAEASDRLAWSPKIDLPTGLSRTWRSLAA